MPSLTRRASGSVRLRRRFALIACGLALALASCAYSGERSIVAHTMMTRQSVGRSSLWVDNTLTAKARWQAQSMANAHWLFHSDLRANQLPGYYALGENVGRGGSVDDIYQAWLASASHYANITDGRWSRIGVAVVRGNDGLYYAVQEFWG